MTAAPTKPPRGPQQARRSRLDDLIAARVQQALGEALGGGPLAEQLLRQLRAPLQAEIERHLRALFQGGGGGTLETLSDLMTGGARRGAYDYRSSRTQLGGMLAELIDRARRNL